MRSRLRAGFLIALLLAPATPARAQLSKVEMPEVRIVFIDPTLAFLVPHATRTFMNALRLQRSIFDFTPQDKITVLMIDLADYGNGAASTTPRNSVQVQVSPVSHLFETVPPAERMSFLMNHELVHIAAMDGSGANRGIRSFFGGKVRPVAEQPESILYFYLTSPRVAAPRWYQEGIATFMDTWMDGGIGRAQGGYDEMVFRSMVRDGARFYDPLGLASEGTKIDFQLESNSYLYGARFMTWLAYQYSPAKLVEWVARKPGTHAYYARQFKAVFGRPIESAWGEWVAFERTFQQENLAAIRTFPVTPAKDLSSRALGSVSRAYFEESTGTIFGAFSYPGILAHVGSIATATGAMTRYVDVKGPKQFHVASLAWDPGERLLFYTTDNAKHRDLIRLDPRTHKTTLLQKDLRTGELVFDHSDKSLWGIRHLNGLCSIVNIPPPYKEWTRLVTLPYGTIAYDLDVSRDGGMIAATFDEPTGRQNFLLLTRDTLPAGTATPLAEFDFGTAVPDNFVFSPDGRYLYGSSYYTGASNIFRYEIATKKIEAVTNAETGFVRPIPLGNDELIVFRYTGEGFLPARITATPLEDVSPITFFGQRTIERHPVLRTWAAGSPSAIDEQAIPTQKGKYGLAGGLQLESIYPVVQGYKDTQAAGMRVMFSDPLMLNRATLSASYSPAGSLASSERLHLAFDYQRYEWSASAAWNGADFYDLFGPTKTSRKGYSAALGHTNTLLLDDPRLMMLKVEGRVAGNLDRLPEYQNIAVNVDRLYSLRADLTNSDLRSSIGYVDDERGQLWSTVFRGDYVNGAGFARLHGTYDVGVATPFPHSSVWIRSAAGWSPQDAAEPFANFFFGGFGNNWVDRATEKRYRESHSFPGFGLNEIGGRNFARTMVEWNLPPLRFSRVGTTGAYLTWARPALFASGLLTNVDRSDLRRTAASIGGQLDFRLTILSRLDMTLSTGAAVGVERDGRARREAMVSLAVLR